MKLYVGNLSFNTTEGELNTAFSQHGEVREATIVMDRDTGRSRGFAFVEFADDDAARNAIKAMDGAEMDGRNLKVNEAKPREGGGNRGGGGRRW